MRARRADLHPALAVGGTTTPLITKHNVVKCTAPSCGYVRECRTKPEAEADARRHRWEAHLSGGVAR